MNTLPNTKSAITSVAFSPTATSLACGSRDTLIHLWPLSQDHLQPRTFPRQRIRQLFRQRRIWMNRLEIARSGAVYALLFSPDGQTLITGSAGSGIELWDVNSGEWLGRLSGYDWVQALALSLDGKTLAAGCGDGSLEFWNLATRRLSHRIVAHGDTITSLAFSADGQFLVSGSNDKKVRLWRWRGD
jgi:WD40 repeat protein